MPFIVLSSEFIFDNKSLTKLDLIYISTALKEVSFTGDDIIIRSSGCSEGLDERGQLYSSHGQIDEIEKITSLLAGVFLRVKLFISLSSELKEDYFFSSI